MITWNIIPFITLSKTSLDKRVGNNLQRAVLCTKYDYKNLMNKVHTYVRCNFPICTFFYKLANFRHLLGTTHLNFLKYS